MRVYKDFRKHKPKIISSIKKFGFSPEHNYYHYLYKQTPYKRCIFFDFRQKRGLVGFYNKSNDVWHVINGILAPYEERLGIFIRFLDYALAKKKAKKVCAEFDKVFKSEIFNRLRNSKYKLSMNYILHWPVYDVKNFDEALKGRKWKKLRNIRNRFCNNLPAKAKNPKKIDKNTLRSILFSWLKRRHARDRVDFGYYLNLIDNNFKGFDMARGLSINNELCSISAGWKIPNSNDFYCGIGFFNYKYKDMGDFVNLDDLIHIKKMGYEHADLGGSDKSILRFKNKFKPEKIYKTYIFSVARRR